MTRSFSEASVHTGMPASRTPAYMPPAIAWPPAEYSRLIARPPMPCTTRRMIFGIDFSGVRIIRFIHL